MNMTTMAITYGQQMEVYDVTGVLLDLAQGITKAVDRLLRVLGDLVSPASPDPESLEERRGYGQR
jgi:hypothetical protein